MDCFWFMQILMAKIESIFGTKVPKESVWKTTKFIGTLLTLFILYVQVFYDWIIYISNILKQADLDGNNRLRLDLLGQCGCADGFTGSDCSQCEGQVQWSGATGLPSCVPMYVLVLNYLYFFMLLGP